MSKKLPNTGLSIRMQMGLRILNSHNFSSSRYEDMKSLWEANN